MSRSNKPFALHSLKETHRETTLSRPPPPATPSADKTLKKETPAHESHHVSYRCSPLKVAAAGAFLLSCLWVAWRMAGSIVVVQGESMLPNFHPNDYALAKPRLGQLERGTVVVLDDGHSDYAIKRVVGLPGETVYLWRGRVFINWRLIQEPYLDRNTCTYPGQKLAVFILGKGQYFVMGDNRGVSLDSRTYGPVGIEKIRKTVSQSAPKVTLQPYILPNLRKGSFAAF